MPQPSAVTRSDELLVLEHLRDRRALGVQHLAAQRQDRLTRAIAALLRRSAGRVALDDEDLALLAAGRRAVAELAGQREARRRRALARDFGLRRAARFTRARRENDARDDRLGRASWCELSQCSSAGRTIESTMAVTSGLFRRSFVWPWNCGSLRKMLSTPTTPSRMSSAVSVTPFGERLCVSMKLRIALPTPARRPFSCVPPDPVGMPLT